MPLKVVCFCRYFAARDTPWRQEDWDAYHFVRALKGYELRGYGHVPVNGVLRRLSKQNASSAIEWFARFVAGYLTKKKITPPFVVIPVPNSACTVRSTTKPHTQKLAKEICDCIGAKAKAVACLRWKKDLGSASKEGGPRDADTLYGNSVLTVDFNDQTTVVLVDDAITSGGHLKACAAKLGRAGADVVIAVCGGRTTYDQGNKPFEIAEEFLEDYEP